MAANFKYRTHATQRYAGTTAGFYNDFVHITGTAGNYNVTPSAGFVLVTVIVNTAPGSGTIVIKCGQDVMAEISSTASATFEHKYNCYMYDVLSVSIPDSTTDITFVVTKAFSGTV